MKKILLTILISLVLAPVTLKAQDYTLLEPLPCIPGTSTDNNNRCDKETNTTKTISLEDYVGYVFKFAIALAAFLAVIMIIWGGLEYMTSEVPFIKTNGRKRIENAVVGLLMVLASYLILATIDPRLVEIQTSIPVIVPNEKDSESVERFRNALTADLERMSAENQLAFKQMETEKKRLEEEKKSIEARLAREEITKEESEVLLTKNSQSTAELIVDKYALTAENIGLEGFQDAYQIINNENTSDNTNLSQYTNDQVPNVLKEGKYPVNTTSSGNTIQNQYNIRINEILSSDPKTAEILGKQRDFYVAQVKEEFYTNNSIQSVRTFSRNSINDKNILNSTLTQSKRDLIDQNKQANSGLPADQYAKIIQTRIDVINKALGN